MLRNRMLLLLGVSFLAASAAWADDVGYVDCSNHSEDIQVFAKPRKTPDVVAAIPCGQRFTIITYGFFFSRIQTGDGKVGYVYSSLIAVDRAATAAQQSGSVQMASAKTRVPSAPPAAVKATPLAQPKAEPAQSAATQPVADAAPASVSALPEVSGPVSEPNPSTTSQTQAMTPQPAATSASTPAPPETAAAPSLSSTPALAQPQPAPAQPEAARATIVSETRTDVAQPSSSAAAQPQPAPAEPAPPAIRPANDRTSWEKPNPTVRTAPLVQLFGGFAFARMTGGGSSSNLTGALASFGFSIKPWLQITGDTSYNVQSSNGVKNILYGNHYGPRLFYRTRNRWGFTPFAEVLVGGTRADTTFSGSSSYNTSDNCFSYKVGGGVDLHPSRHFDIRLFDVDYYRTSFGTNVNQSNYWISTGIVLRLFGDRE